MAQLLTMPQLGSTMEEGQIVRWIKQEGDTVQQGEILLEIMTDKANMEVEATASGVLRKILAPVDALVPIHEPIAIVGDATEPIDALIGAGSGGVPEAAPMEQMGSVVSTAQASDPAAPIDAIAASVFLSPRARRLAGEHSVPLLSLSGRGTGPDGRVLERDVQAFIGERALRPAASEEATSRHAPRATPLAARIAGDLGVNLEDLAVGLPGSRVRSEDVLRHAERRDAAPSAAESAGLPVVADYVAQPFTGLRRRISDNITKSAFTAPHVTLTLEVDMSSAAEFRAKVIPEVEKTYGSRVSFTDILVKAVARALVEHPALNAALVGDEVRVYSHRNVGVAVALDDGLIVPVIHDADVRPLGAVSAELRQLVDRARKGKFTPDDLAGGTFSITNLGTFGIDVFDPIIVPPQAAILGVGRIADKPVVINGQVAVRSMMNLCLSFDHRILDGVPAARFLQRVKELLENPLAIVL